MPHERHGLMIMLYQVEIHHWHQHFKIFLFRKLFIILYNCCFVQVIVFYISHLEVTYWRQEFTSRIQRLSFTPLHVYLITVLTLIGGHIRGREPQRLLFHRPANMCGVLCGWFRSVNWITWMIKKVFMSVSTRLAYLQCFNDRFAEESFNKFLCTKSTALCLVL